jgi:hypothetical protein
MSKIEVDATEHRSTGLKVVLDARAAQQADEDRLVRDAEAQRVRLKRGTDTEKKTSHGRATRDKHVERTQGKQANVRERSEKLQTSHASRSDEQQRVRQEQEAVARSHERASNKIPERDFPTNPFPE